MDWLMDKTRMDRWTDRQTDRQMMEGWMFFKSACAVTSTQQIFLQSCKFACLIFHLHIIKPHYRIWPELSFPRSLLLSLCLTFWYVWAKMFSSTSLLVPSVIINIHVCPVPQTLPSGIYEMMMIWTAESVPSSCGEGDQCDPVEDNHVHIQREREIPANNTFSSR